jgi:ABC-2 type transport system permease protein
MMRIIDIALKDLTRSFRSAFAVGVMVIAPLLLIGLIYFAFGGTSGGPSDLPTLSVGVVNTDRLPADAPLDHPLGEDIRSLFNDENVKLWINPSDYADKDSALEALDEGTISVAVIIPQDFTERTLNGERDIQVQIINHPTQTIASQAVKNIVIAMLDGYAGNRIATKTVIERYKAVGMLPVHAEIQALSDQYNAWYADFQRDMFDDHGQALLSMIPPSVEGESENRVQKMLGLMMAGQMAFFAFFTGAYSMMSILREDEEGTLARLFTMPVGRTHILAGKFCAVFLTVSIQGFVLIIAAHYCFGIAWGKPVAVLLALIGQVVVAAGLGVLLISFVKTTQQGGPVLGGGLTVLGILGGLFTSGLSMPDAFTKLAVLTPQGWVIKAWHCVLGELPLGEVVIVFFVLMVMGIIMFTAGALMFIKRFAQ